MTTLLVSADDVGVLLGLDYPLPGDLRPRIEMEIRKSQGKVQGFLNRPLVAYKDTITNLIPDRSWPLTDKRAWAQVANYYNDKYAVDSYVANAQNGDGYDVTFTVGLDVANDPDCEPIIQWILQDSKDGLARDSLFRAISRRVESVSSDGQSVTYEHHRGYPSPTASGSAPDLKSLKKFKRYSISQKRMERLTPWPYAYRNW